LNNVTEKKVELAYYYPEEPKVHPDASMNWQAYSNIEIFQHLKFGLLSTEEIKSARELLKQRGIKENIIKELLIKRRG
jgi:hypothetical protein